MNSARLPRSRVPQKSIKDMDKDLQSIGLDTSKARARSISQAATRRSRRDKRRRADADPEAKGMEIDNTGRRSLSRVGKRQRRDESGLKSETEKKKAEKLKRMGEKKWKSEARKGAADRRVLDLKPKHLNSGKRGIGKTDWR